MDLFELLDFDPAEVAAELKTLRPIERTKAALAARHLYELINEIQKDLGDFEA